MDKIRWKVGIFYMRHILRWCQYLHNFMAPPLKDDDLPRVFFIGAPKTGTTSLHKALQMLGYRAVKLLNLKGWDRHGRDQYVRDIKKWKYNVFSDFPFGYEDLYKKIDQMYPNSKFILTIRDSESLKRSNINFYKGTDWRGLSEPIEKGIKEYEERNKQIIEYFKDRPSQLLVIDIIKGEGWENLCKFLDKPIPDKPFPRSNVGRYRKKKK